MKKMNNKGFSLVELIIVIAIMAVLVGVLAPQFLRYVEQSRVQKDESAMGEVNNAVKIACSVEKVYDELPSSGTVSVTYGASELTSWSISSYSELSSELNKTVPTVSAFASKKYKGADATTTISINATDGTVDVQTHHSANTSLTIR